MTSIKFALLSLLAGAAVARPQESQHNVHSKFHTGSIYPSGSGYPFRSKSVGTAPFPANNSTLGGATASTGGSGPVTVLSTISVVPTPVSNGGSAAAASGSGYGAGSNSGALGASDNRNAGSAADQTCGPATVTVTSANIVTVTITPAGGAGAASNAPVSSSAPYVPPVSSAPFPVANSSSLAGTGTGTAISRTRVKSTPYTKSVASSSSSSSSAAYVAPVSSSASSSPTVASVASPAVSPSDTNKPVVGAEQKNAVQQQKSSTVASSAPAASSSSAVQSTTGPAKGVIYPVGTESRAASMAPAWACNWAATPNTQLSSKTDFIPQLWGPSHKDEIKDTSASTVLFYNEPNLCTGGGSCVDVQKAIPDWTSYMKPLQQSGKKVSSPCVSNDQLAMVGSGSQNNQYLDTFLSAFPSGTMDILCFHWYGTCLSGDGCLQQTVEQAQKLQQKHGIKELWLSEMGDNNMIPDISHYTKYLDSGVVNRYAYNLANLPAGASM